MDDWDIMKVILPTIEDTSMTFIASGKTSNNKVFAFCDSLSKEYEVNRGTGEEKLVRINPHTKKYFELGWLNTVILLASTRIMGFDQISKDIANDLKGNESIRQISNHYARRLHRWHNIEGKQFDFQLIVSGYKNNLEIFYFDSSVDKQSHKVPYVVGGFKCESSPLFKELYNKDVPSENELIDCAKTAFDITCKAHEEYVGGDRVIIEIAKEGIKLFHILPDTGRIIRI